MIFEVVWREDLIKCHPRLAFDCSLASPATTNRCLWLASTMLVLSLSSTSVIQSPLYLLLHQARRSIQCMTVPLLLVLSACSNQ